MVYAFSKQLRAAKDARKVSTSWQQYLQDYKSAWAQLQKLSPPLLTYDNRALYSTWNISYASIRQRNESAAMLLRLWAFFGNEDLWYELVREGRIENGPKWLWDLTETRLAFEYGMRELCNHGLVEAHSTAAQSGTESSGYSVHSCVHSWMIHVLNGPNEQDLPVLAMKCTSLHVTIEMVPEAWFARRRLMLHGDRCRQLLSKIGNVESYAPIQANLGLLYVAQERPEEAVALYIGALQGFEKVCGLEHTCTLDILNRLAYLYDKQGRFKRAEAVYNLALRVEEKVLGPKHTSTLRTLKNFASLIADKGRFKEAEAMFEQVIKGYEKAWGPNHAETLDAVYNLARLHVTQGQYQKAETLFNRALQGYKTARDPENLSTLNTLHNLGCLYRYAERHKEAEAMFKRALQVKEEAWGLEHRSTLDTVHSLASLYRDQERFKEAEAMYTRALQGFKKTRGLEDLLTIAKVHNIANLYMDQKRFQEAEAMYDQALQSFEKACGPESMLTLEPVQNLVVLYKRQGRLRETKAVAMYNRALQGYQKVLANENYHLVFPAIKRLGSLYAVVGQETRAKELFIEVLPSVQAYFGDDSKQAQNLKQALASWTTE